MRRHDNDNARGVLPTWAAWLVVLALAALLGLLAAAPPDPPCAPPGISLLGPGECGTRHFRAL